LPRILALTAPQHETHIRLNSIVAFISCAQIASKGSSKAQNDRFSSLRPANGDADRNCRIVFEQAVNQPSVSIRCIGQVF